MKLVLARFENFRLLRNLELNFSTDSTRKLTVIRAENETGKTTILNALQWAFYGDDALPRRGKDYRLHPIDWNLSDGQSIPISIQVEFEITKSQQNPIASNFIETTEKYRIIRSTCETLDGGTYKRNPSTVKLFQITDSGNKPIVPPDAWIAEELPPELREVFFTDGDRALSFIEAAANPGTKRARVENAIKSLLGLGIIEDALKHMKATVSKVNRKVKGIEGNETLKQIAIRLEEIETESKELQKKIKDSQDQFDSFSEKLSETQKKIEEVLSKGDREALKSDLKETKANLESLDKQKDDAAKAHNLLFSSLFLARDLLDPILEKTFTKLGSLYEEGKVPHTTIPVLEDRLRGTTCICGESLDPHEPEGGHRRNHIQRLIAESRPKDDLQSTLAVLCYAADPLRPNQNNDESDWISEYTEIERRRTELEIRRNKQGSRLKALETRLDQIPDTDIQGLRSTEQYYIKQRDRFNTDKVRNETLLETLRKESKKKESDRDKLLRKQKKEGRILAQLHVAQDVEKVLKNSYDRIRNKELAKVSSLMNTIFLEMIVADPKDGATIQKAEISKDFDILVYGPNEQTLDPDIDLNGASRRALTIAFILALTKVSEVNAPNVIDTPLATMSGQVKQSVLEVAIRESSQLVLFLTRSEIADCGKILDATAGRVITLTNSEHYPSRLVNRPPTQQSEVLRCECTHSETCSLCERKIDTQSTSEEMNSGTAIS